MVEPAVNLSVLADLNVSLGLVWNLSLLQEKMSNPVSRNKSILGYFMNRIVFKCTQISLTIHIARD